MHGQTKQRLKTLAQVPEDIAPEAVLNAEGGLKIRWASVVGEEGAHESFFPYTFLERAAYDPPVLRTAKYEERE
jgi:trimethyllysine dioxygenase